MERKNSIETVQLLLYINHDIKDSKNKVLIDYE